MGFRYEIRLSGSGGQGLILMGIILAEGIGIYEGKFVAQTQSYGPEARGGVSKSEVIVSDEEIDYPKAMRLDLLLAMNQKSVRSLSGPQARWDPRRRSTFVTRSLHRKPLGFLLPGLPGKSSTGRWSRTSLPLGPSLN
jgi:hypothetical protein